MRVKLPLDTHSHGKKSKKCMLVIIDVMIIIVLFFTYAFSSFFSLNQKKIPKKIDNEIGHKKLAKHSCCIHLFTDSRFLADRTKKKFLSSYNSRINYKFCQPSEFLFE